MPSFAFRLFDTEAVIESDEPEVIAPFARAYDRFRISRPRPDAVRYHVRSNGELMINGQAHHVRSPDLLADYAYTRIQNDLWGRIRSHFLVHAAALSHNGRGLLIAGPSGFGKTTLALALVRRGYTLLSDDVAALGRADGLLHPFPRAPLVRDGEMVDLDPGKPCPPRLLIELHNGRSSGRKSNGKWLWATVDRAPGRLLGALRRIGGVERVQARRIDGFFEIALEGATGAAIETELEAVCREQDVMLFDVRCRLSRGPDFDREPELTPMPAHEVALALMRHLRGGVLSQSKGGPRSALVEAVGAPGQTFLALAEFAAAMEGYRLRVGDKAAMVSRVQKIEEGLGRQQ